jgi:hypothetical protein
MSAAGTCNMLKTHAASSRYGNAVLRMLTIISISAGVCGGRARNEPRHCPLTAGKLITRQLGCNDEGSIGGACGGPGDLSMSAGLSGIRFEKTRIRVFFC